MKISAIGGEAAWFASLFPPWQPVWFYSWLARGRERRASMRVLTRLDRRLLADIGLERHRILDSFEVYSRHEK